MTKANYQNATDLYPSTGLDDAAWTKVFDTDPDIMWAIIADAYTVAVDERDRENGIRRTGRRPRRVPANMDELLQTVMPQHWNNEPFPCALRLLIGGRSQQQFARRVPVSQATMSRFLSGSQTPDLSMLERLASAGKVPPYYFVEHRALFVAELVQRSLMAQPHLGVKAMKAYLTAIGR